MITIQNKATAGAAEGAFRQGHLLSVVTPVAILVGVGRVDGNESTPGPFCLDAQQITKPRPRCIHDALSKTVVVNHAIGGQVLDGDDTKAVDEFATVLVDEVLTLPGDAFVDTRYNLVALGTLRRPLGLLGQTAMCLCKCPFLLAHKAWVVNLFTIAERGKGGQAKINSNWSVIVRQWRWLPLAREGDKPLARCRAPDCDSFWDTLKRAVEFELNVPNLGQVQTPILQTASARMLGKGEAVVAVPATESRVSWLLSGFCTAKERLERKVNANSYILQHLAVNLSQRLTFMFEGGKRFLLRKARQRFSVLPVGVSTLREQVIVEPAAFFKPLGQQAGLFLCRVQAVLKGFKHKMNYSLKPGLSQALAGLSTFYIPLDESRGFENATASVKKDDRG